MAILDRALDPADMVSLKLFLLSLGTTATSQTGKLTDTTVPGFPFQVVSVEVDALTVTATMAVDVQKGPVGGSLTSVLSATVTPVAVTPTAGTLSATAANTMGLATDSLAVLYTSGGSGAATNCFVRVWVRPIPAQANP